MTLPTKLEQACLLAVAPGLCEYVNGRMEALCVIAHLGELHGINANRWRSQDSVSSHEEHLKKLPYNPKFLRALQEKWDSAATTRDTSYVMYPELRHLKTLTLEQHRQRLLDWAKENYKEYHTVDETY